MKITILFLAVSAGLYGQSIAFTAPASDGDQVTTRNYSMTVSVSSMPTVATVEYTSGTKLLGVATASPWSYTFDFLYFFADGNIIDLKATARDAFGAVIATATRRARINAWGNELTTSVDLSQTFSGTNNLTFTSTPSTGCTDQMVLSIDGDDFWQDQGLTGDGNPASLIATLPTTQYPNGQHELYVGARSWDCISGNYKDWRGMLITTIDIQNGHTLSEIAPSHWLVPLTPAQTFTLGCNAIYTDDVNASCTSPSFSSNNAAVATVNSSTGVITAVADGVATITVSAHSKTTTAYVLVRASQYVPHFAKDGSGFRTSYLAGTSKFPIAPFILYTFDMDTNSTYKASIIKAKQNTLTMGYWIDPPHSTGDSFSDTYAQWLTDYNNNIQTGLTWAATNNFSIYATGDAAAKAVDKLQRLMNWAPGQTATEYAISNLRNTGRAFAIDVLDEADYCWGGTPKPVRYIGSTDAMTQIVCSGTSCTMTWPGHYLGTASQIYLTGASHSQLNTTPGSYFPITGTTSTTVSFTISSSLTGTFNSSTDPTLEYLAFQEGGACGRGSLSSTQNVPNTAITDYIGWVKGASPTMKLAMPPRGVVGSTVFDAWTGRTSISNNLSDFQSSYWVNGKLTYPFGMTARTTAQQMLDTTFVDRGAVIDWDKPTIHLTVMPSISYYKQSTNTNQFYDPLVDTKDAAGSYPASVMASLGAAIAMGAAGIRPYEIENIFWAASRAGVGVGVYCQQGSGPVNADVIGVRNWYASGHWTVLMAGRLEPFILGNFVSAIGLGRGIVTAARSNAAGDKMLMVQNTNDAPRTFDVDFSEYKSSGVNGARYEVEASKIITTSVTTTSQTLTLDAGAAMFYLFPVSSGTTYLTSTTLAIDTTGYPTAARVGVMTDHVWNESFTDRSDYTECTLGSCTALLDRSMDTYYKYVLTESDGTPLFTSDPILISASGQPSTKTRGKGPVRSKTVFR